MSEDSKKEQSLIVASERAARMKVVTPQEVVTYLNAINENAKCTFCKVGELGVSASPSGKTAALVSCDVPGNPGIGMWLFPAACINCGMTLLFSAVKVAEWLEGSEK